MSKDNVKEILAIQRIEEKIFKFKSIYHPNLVANLSKEAYDLYIIRNSIGEQILEELHEKGRISQKIYQFITKKIREIEMKLKNTTDILQIDFLKLSLEEWKAFL